MCPRYQGCSAAWAAPIEEILAPGAILQKRERNRLIRLAHRQHGYTLKEIAEALGLHYTTISKAIDNAKN